MNQKKEGYDGPRPTYLHEVKVNGYKLARGMHATLAPLPGRKEKRRYEFRYGEMLSTSDGPLLMLTFYGPVRGCQRFRTAREADVLIVHTKSERRA